MDQALGQADRNLTFRVDGQSFAFRAELVREVARMPCITQVPHAPTSLLGLANVRGSVIPVLSMARLLGRTASPPARIIIVDAGEKLALAVDQACQVAESGATDAIEVDLPELLARTMPAHVARRARGGAAVRQNSHCEDEIATVPLVVFVIGNQEFAMPLEGVEEVLRLPAHITVMPDVDDVVRGSMALRGAVLPLLSLSALLGLPARADTRHTRVLVVRIGQHRVGLLVDTMRSFLRVPDIMIDAVPQVFARGKAEARIQAICRLDDSERLVSVLAPDKLLRDDITARLLQGDAGEHKAMGKTADNTATGVDTGTEQFLLFRIADTEFGMPIGAVEEVAPLPARLTRLPKAPAFVLGVMNLRGRVIPVIDQAQRFGTDRSATVPGRVVVARIGDQQAGFIVDAVSEVAGIAAGVLQPVPRLGGEDNPVFDRVARVGEDQRIVLIVNPRELLDRTEQEILSSFSKKAAQAAS